MARDALDWLREDNFMKGGVTMKLCDDRHEEICYGGDKCPLCEELERIITLEAMIDDYREETSDLEVELDELKEELSDVKRGYRERTSGRDISGRLPR